MFDGLENARQALADRLLPDIAHNLLAGQIGDVEYVYRFFPEGRDVS